MEPSADLRVETRVEGETTIVAVHGEVDLHTVSALEDELGAFALQTPVVDMRGCSFIDSHGLRALFQAAKRARRRGETLVVVCDDPTIRRVFEIAGLTRLVEVADGTRLGSRSTGDGGPPPAWPRGGV